MDKKLPVLFKVNIFSKIKSAIARFISQKNENEINAKQISKDAINETDNKERTDKLKEELLEEILNDPELANNLPKQRMEQFIGICEEKIKQNKQIITELEQEYYSLQHSFNKNEV